MPDYLLSHEILRCAQKDRRFVFTRHDDLVPPGTKQNHQHPPA